MPKYFYIIESIPVTLEQANAWIEYWRKMGKNFTLSKYEVPARSYV